MNEHSLKEYLDRLESPFVAGECGREGREDLILLYEEFSPKAMAQGLPPARDLDRIRWIDGLLSSGWNFIAWQDGKPSGHSALMPDLKRGDAEYIVFVIQRYRNRGLGTVLTSIALEAARARGLHTVWLTVESINFRAIRLYRRAGFQFCDEGERDRTMLMRL